MIEILHKLLPFRESSYWLTKVELLQTLGCLDFTSLAVLDSQLPEVVLSEVIFKLLGDVDHRYMYMYYMCIILNGIRLSIWICTLRWYNYV